MSITLVKFISTTQVEITDGGVATEETIEDTTFDLSLSDISSANVTIEVSGNVVLDPTPKINLVSPSGYTNQQIIVDCSNLTIDGDDGLGNSIEIDLTNQPNYKGLISLTNGINTTTTIQNITMNVSNSTLAIFCGLICRGNTDNIGGLTIRNCNVTSSEDLTIGGDTFTGGIMGGYNQNNNNISISNCNVTSSGDLTIGGDGTFVGGIMGGFNNNNTEITLTNCNVTSSGDLTIGGGAIYIGGIMGGGNENNTEINITSCNVTSKVGNIAIGGDATFVGGIMGGYNLKNTEITLTNCNVTSSGNLTIGGGAVYTGGIMGGSNENNTEINITSCDVSFCNRQNTFSYQGSNIEMPSPPSTKTSVKITKLQITSSTKQYVVGTNNTPAIRVINVFIINNCYSNNQGISPVLTPTVNGGYVRSSGRELVRRTAPRIGLLKNFKSYNEKDKRPTKIPDQSSRLIFLKLQQFNKAYNNPKT